MPHAPPAWSFQALLEDLAGRGEVPAILAVKGEEARTWTAAQVADLARRLAAGLRAEGLAPGAPVAMFAPNMPEWVVVRLALGAAGLLTVGIDDQATGPEVRTLMTDSGARLVFSIAAHMPTLRQLGEQGLDLAPVLLDAANGGGEGARHWLELLADEAEALPPVDPDAPTTLVYTSGTTGNPKSFTLTGRQIGANVVPLVAEGLIGARDRALLPLPLHHIYPVVVGMSVSLASGAALVFPETVAGPQIVTALKVGRVSLVIGVPRLYAGILTGLESRFGSGLAARSFRRLVDACGSLRKRTGLNPGKVLFAPLHRRIGPNLRILVSGGARLDAVVLHRLVGLGWDVRSGYGLAETASIFTGNLPDGRERWGSEGRPFQGGEITIADPDEGGTGEILLRGPNVFDGYRNHPEANRAAFTEDGWFRTGDLGRLDEDGFLYVTGRAKEMIVLAGGKNVFPEELEKAYGESPYVAEIAVLEYHGDLVALVRPDMAAAKEAGYSRIDDVLRVSLTQIGQTLSRYQRLSGFALVREPLPRTRLGKFRRFLLPDLYRRAKAGETRAAATEPTAEDRALLAREPVAGIWAMLQERYRDKPLSLDASPQLDLGIDSLEWMNLSMELEQRFGVRLDEAAVADVVTVRDLLQAAAEAGAAGEDAALPAPGSLPAEKQRRLEPIGPARRALGGAIYALLRLLMRTLFRVRASGLEHLPAEGPFVIAANHASDLDPLVVAAALPRDRLRRVWWGGDSGRLFGGPVRRFFARALRIFPVDDRAPAATLAMALAVLDRGQALVWFPESWRSPTGELQPFLHGIGTVLSESRVPVVPAWIEGAYEAMPRDRRWPRLHPIRVTFGPARRAGELEPQGEGESRPARIASGLREAVAALAGPAGEARH